MRGIKVWIRNKDQANVVALFNVLNSLTFFVQQIGGNRYRQLGFDLAGLNYHGVASTANGMTRTALVRLDEVTLEGHEAQNVRALINEGELHGSLLGMGYLERFSRIEILRDRLRITF